MKPNPTALGLMPIPLILLRKLTNVNPLIINYHVVSDAYLPHVAHLYKYRNVKTFTEDLKYLKRHYYPISIVEFLDHIKNKTILPRNSFMLTFDDGFKEVYSTVAPILQELSLTTTVFMTRNYLDNLELGYDQKKSLILEHLLSTKDDLVKNKIFSLVRSCENDLKKAILGIPYDERLVVDEIAALLQINTDAFLQENKPYLTTSQVKELLDMGFTFGGHGIDHPRFIELSPKERINQSVTSVDFMVNLLNLNYRVFAFPYSDLGLPSSFYRDISDRVDATFGTQGMLKDSASNNFHRINVEKTEKKASSVLRFHYIKQLKYQLLGKEKINRRRA